jgi:hypothetical protein
MSDFEAQVLGDLQVLKSQMEQILGIGQPGRLHALEDRLAATELITQRLRGAAAAFGIVLTLLNLAVSLWARH